MTFIFFVVPENSVQGKNSIYFSYDLLYASTVLRARDKSQKEGVLCFGEVYNVAVNLRKPVYSVGEQPFFATAHSAMSAPLPRQRNKIPQRRLNSIF